MINLMYVVLMAMLAINVSSDVLDGFTVIEDSMRRTTEGTSQENGEMYRRFAHLMELNPQKVKPWAEKADEVKQASDELYDFTEELRKDIVRHADGKRKAWRRMFRLDNKEATEPVAQVMLSPGTGRSEKLLEAINNYRKKITSMISSPVKKELIEKNLSTDIPEEARNNGKTWSEYMFEAMPAAAAVTMLTKLQSDIRYAEGETLHELLSLVDEKDVRVNALEAFVIPYSRTVVRGEEFHADIVMAAIDSTKAPRIIVTGDKGELKGNSYSIACNATGDFKLEGFLETSGDDGSEIRMPFSQQYTVIEPSATVSADMMNMLYAGYDNPVSISIPGVPPTAVRATMKGGSLIQKGPGKYIARPSLAGSDAVISVSKADAKGDRHMGQYRFMVRKLPQPTPFIALKDEKGATDIYKGGAIVKTSLIDAERIGAAVDDGILHIPFRVKKFDAVVFDNMGNAVPIPSDGDMFSKAQKDTFKRLARGRRVYISRMTVTGPDGQERVLNTSMEMILR